MRFAALQERAAGRRGALTRVTDTSTNAPAAKRLWRCRFCRTLLRIARAGVVVTCPQCLQQTAIAKEVA